MGEPSRQSHRDRWRRWRARRRLVRLQITLRTERPDGFYTRRDYLVELDPRAEVCAAVGELASPPAPVDRMANPIGWLDGPVRVVAHVQAVERRHG